MAGRSSGHAHSNVYPHPMVLAGVSGAGATASVRTATRTAAGAGWTRPCNPATASKGVMLLSASWSGWLC